MDKLAQPSQIYARALYTLGRGCPLWIPEPNDELPVEYLEGGIRIGDVGVLRTDGSFGFIFNACCTANDPVNANGVPDGFQPLVWNGSNCHRRNGIFPPADPIVSGGAETRELGVEGTVSLPGVPIGGGVGLSIKFGRNRGAIIIPPNGVNSRDCESRRLFRDYATRHATSWYEFVHETLGMEVDNGSIYFITGFDKTDCWENAVFSSNLRERSCELIVTTGGLGGGEGRIKLSDSSLHASFFRRRSPPDNQYQNQALFIRGFRISTPPKFRAFFGGTSVEVTSTYEASWKDALGKKGPSRPNTQWGHSPSASRSSGSGSVGEKSSSACESNDPHESSSAVSWRSGSSDTSLDEDDLIPMSEIYHPLKIINDHILQLANDIHLVITHDEDWISLLNREDFEMPDDTTLIKRLRALYHITVKDGCALLDPIETPCVSFRQGNVVSSNHNRTAFGADTQADVTQGESPQFEVSKDDDADDHTTPSFAFSLRLRRFFGIGLSKGRSKSHSISTTRANGKLEAPPDNTCTNVIPPTANHGHSLTWPPTRLSPFRPFRYISNHVKNPKHRKLGDIDFSNAISAPSISGSSHSSSTGHSKSKSDKSSGKAVGLKKQNHAWHARVEQDGPRQLVSFIDDGFPSHSRSNSDDSSDIYSDSQ